MALDVRRSPYVRLITGLARTDQCRNAASKICLFTSCSSCVTNCKSRVAHASGKGEFLSVVSSALAEITGAAMRNARKLMMCRLVVGERAHQRPKQKAERPNDPQLYVEIERKAQTEIAGNDSDQESDEYANQEPHLSPCNHTTETCKRLSSRLYRPAVYVSLRHQRRTARRHRSTDANAMRLSAYTLCCRVELVLPVLLQRLWRPSGGTGWY